MSERIVEVVWEDSVARDGWTDKVVTVPESYIFTAGYIQRDDERGVVLLFSKDHNESSGTPYGCSMFIPRSAIRKVTELKAARRKR
jgi:hypothetical protein